MKKYWKIITLFTVLNLGFFAYNAYYDKSKHLALVAIGLVLFTAFEFALLKLVFFLKEKKKWKIEKIFLLLAIIVGTAHAFITPMNQVPDEIVHIMRTNDIAEGNVVSKKNESGHYRAKISKTFWQVLNNGSGDSKYYGKVAVSMFESASDEKWGYDFDSTAIYKPISYLPQTLGIIVGKVLHLPIVMSMYLARLFAVLAYAVIVYFAIKLTPKYKEFFLLFALLPMSLQQAGSFSVDMMVIASAFFTIALAMNYIYGSDKKLSGKQIAIMYAAILITSATKSLAYLPLGLAFVLTPASKFKSTFRKFLHLAMIVIIAVSSNYAWVSIQDKTTAHQSSESVSETAEVEPAKKQNPTTLEFLNMAFGTFLGANTDHIVNGAFGMNLSYKYAAPLRAYVYIMIILIVVMVLRSNEKLEKRKYDKLVFWAIPILLCVAFYYIAAYQWGFVENGRVISGIQGRYFIPLLPLIPLMAYYDKKEKAESFDLNYVYMFVIFANVCVLATKFLHNI